MTPEYIELKKAVEKQRKVIARKQALVKKQQDIMAELLSGCTHEELVEENYHFSGSYYDKAYTDHWMRCKLCSAKGPVTSERHSWYG